ncbi:MAG: peptidoglycan glycosyltransferase [Chitinophagales bacterium]|jgi:peptidoglycan glycosyltransferase
MKNRFNVKPSSLTFLPFVLLTLVLLVTNWSIAAAEQLSIQSVADVITSHAKQNRFPNKLVFTDPQGQQAQGIVEYTFDEAVHKDMAEVYLKYQPDYACFVALDVETGAILNLTSFIKSDEQWENLVMRSEYPAASVFKMVTAAAGLDLGKMSPNTVLPFNGKSTTLYKGQVLRHKTNKWTRNPTLKESFAKSINSVFGRIGIYQLGADNLSQYATRFGFGQSMNTDFNLPMSRVGLDLSNQWHIAEAASGYTKDITLSPIHAAQMAAIIANDGSMVTPYMVKSIKDLAGNQIYKARADPTPEKVISQKSAKALRSLMTETTRIGSARKSFKGLSRYKVYSDMEIGGKTGSLTGYSPKGRHDWFVGYAEKNGRKVAYASLIINKEKWYVRSAYVARQFIYNYFTDLAEKDSIAASSE